MYVLQRRTRSFHFPSIGKSHSFASYRTTPDRKVLASPPTSQVTHFHPRSCRSQSFAVITSRRRTGVTALRTDGGWGAYWGSLCVLGVTALRADGGWGVTPRLRPSGRGVTPKWWDCWGHSSSCRRWSGCDPGDGAGRPVWLANRNLEVSDRAQWGVQRENPPATAIDRTHQRSVISHIRDKPVPLFALRQGLANDDQHHTDTGSPDARI